MTSPRLLVIDPGAEGNCDVFDVLRDADVGVLERASAFVGAPVADYDVLTVNYDALGDDDRAALVSHFSGDHGPTRLLLVSGAVATNDYITLFGNHALMNLLACNRGHVDPRDTATTLRKIVERDIFGLDKYMAVGPSALRMTLHSSDEKLDAMSRIENYALLAGLHVRLVEHACTVADEFITNAFYNAPIDADGKPRHAHRSRLETVTLEPGEAVEIVVAFDGRRLGLSTVDPFGTLTEQKLLDYLAKCFRGGENQIDRKEGGAGLGLYFAFKNLSHLVVNIGRSTRTEMIGLIDAHATYRDFARRGKSFNVFTTTEG